MWMRLLLQEQAADVFCVEVCGNLQNFQDKRSRFSATTGSLLVRCPRDWLLESTYSDPKQPRWETIAGTNERVPDKELLLPIRHQRVLFVLPGPDYLKLKRNSIAAGHEYFMRHSSLRSLTSPKMQRFIKDMAPEKHFYTQS
jgi:hypothetical protein